MFLQAIDPRLVKFWLQFRFVEVRVTESMKIEAVKKALQVSMMRIECEVTATGLFHISNSLLIFLYNQTYYNQ